MTNLEEKVDSAFKNLELYTDKLTNRVDIALEVFMKAPEYGLKKTMELFESFTDAIYSIFGKDTNIARLLRYGSLPWSVLIPKVYKYFFSDYNQALLFKPGVHLIVAKVGGGKSLSSFILAEMYLEKTGKGSYFTSPVEKPQLTEDGNWLFVHHRVVDPSDYYKDGKKIKQYNTNKYDVFHKDELLARRNRRENKTAAYNKTFIPELRDEIYMRHQGMKIVYKYSQSPYLDGQEMELLSYMHEVKTVKTIPLKQWLETGNFPYIPVKLKFTTYELEVRFGNNSIKRKKVGSCVLPVPYEVLQRFETHAESNRYSHLPYDYK